MRIIQMSDIHIGKSKNAKKMVSLVEWIINEKKSHNTDVVVITGDIVDDGALWQYREAKKQIDKLKNNGFKVFFAPGNHDYGWYGITESETSLNYFKKYISGDVDYPNVQKHDNCYFIMLDSMQKEMEEYEIWGSQGKLGKEQLRNLDRILDEIESDGGDSKIVIGLHHHPFYFDYFLKLRDDDLFKKVITDENGGKSRINCLMFGHKHDEKRFNTGNPSKEEKYGIDIVFACGSSTERDEKGRMVIPVIDLNKKGIEKFYVK